MSSRGWRQVLDEGVRRSEERRQTVVVRLEAADLGSVTTRADGVETLKQHADRSQQSIRRFALKRAGMELRDSFWITNAVLVDVDTEDVSLRELAERPGVKRIHENVAFQAHEATTDQDGSYTYGLQEIDVPQV